MANEIIPETSLPVETAPETADVPFGELLAEFEHAHSHKTDDGTKQLQGTVVSLDAEFVYLDIGYKSEGILPRSAFENNAEKVSAGDGFPGSVKRPQACRHYEL